MCCLNVQQQHKSFQFYFILFTHIFKPGKLIKKHVTYYLLRLGVSTHSDSLILWELPSITRELPLDHLEACCLTYGHFSSSCWGEKKSVSHSPPPSHILPDGLGSQTGNLAVTNPPHEPSGHSCPPCRLVISSCGKLDASKHKVHSRCLKCHNITMQVVDWQRGRFRFLATASEHLLSSLPHEKGGIFHLVLFTREACICAHILFNSSYIFYT